jgi:hypothetical protein
MLSLIDPGRPGIQDAADKQHDDEISCQIDEHQPQGTSVPVVCCQRDDRSKQNPGSNVIDGGACYGDRAEPGVRQITLHQDPRQHGKRGNAHRSSDEEGKCCVITVAIARNRYRAKTIPIRSRRLTLMALVTIAIPLWCRSSLKSTRTPTRKMKIAKPTWLKAFKKPSDAGGKNPE